MSQRPARGYWGACSNFIRRVGGALVAPGATRRGLLAGGPGGFPDLLVLLSLQMLSVHIVRIVRSVWFASAVGTQAGLPGLTQVALGVLVRPLILALGASVLLRLVTPEGRARERALDQASLCVIPSVILAVAESLISTASGGASRALLGSVPLATGMVWALGLVVYFALEARREQQGDFTPDPGAGAGGSRAAGWGAMLLVVVVLAINVTTLVRDLDSIRPVTTGAAAPGFNVRATKRAPVSLASLRGKVVLISFWASWCTPCLREMPFLQQLQTDLGPRGLQVLAINVEAPAELGQRMDVIRKRHPRLPLYGGGQRVANRYGVQTLPHLVLVDKKGRVAQVQIGSGNEEGIKKKIAGLL